MKKTFVYSKGTRHAILNYEISEYTFKKYNGYWKVFPRGIIYFIPWINRVVWASRKCPDIQKISYDINQLIGTWKKEEQLDFLLKFCRSAVYETDTNLYKIFDYWATAQETLYLGKGDCEDSSILLNTFLLEFGFDTKFVLMKDHMACAIYGNYTGYFLEDGTKKYYYIESVANKPIGVISDKNRAKAKCLIDSK